MEHETRDVKLHEQHKVLTIRGKSYCDASCIFCVEKFTTYHPVAPGSDETRKLILEGAGKYNMLFFMNGEPTLHPKLFDYVDLAREHGYRYFGMSSHFRAFADPRFTLKVLEAGFEFFDISLHAASLQMQAELNPVGDGGASLKEALHGVRNLYETARRYRRRIAVTHKIVICRVNYRHLLPIFRSTYRFGVRNFILQPVKVSGLEPALMARLTINEDEFMPEVNEFLRQTEGSGAEIKLYGMSQLGVYPSGDVVQESNVIKHAFTKADRGATLSLHEGDRIIPEVVLPSIAPGHKVTVRLPERAQTAESGAFECKEDQFILNAALASGLPLPFGCRMGSCGMCCGRVVEGTVEQTPQLILSEAQLAQGYRLMCKSKPRSDVVIITHQDIARPVAHRSCPARGAALSVRRAASPGGFLGDRLRVRAVRLELEDRLVLDDGCREVPGLRQLVAEVEVCGGVGGVLRRRGVEVRERARIVLLPDLASRALRPELGGVLQRDGLREDRHALRERLQHVQLVRDASQDADVLACQRDGRLQLLQGPVLVPERPEPVPVDEAEVGVGRRDGDRDLELANRTRLVLLPAVRDGRVQVERAVPGVRREPRRDRDRRARRRSAARRHRARSGSPAPARSPVEPGPRACRTTRRPRRPPPVRRTRRGSTARPRPRGSPGARPGSASWHRRRRSPRGKRAP